MAAGLIGSLAGLLIADAVLDKFSLSATGVVEATVIFWLLHLVVSLFALRVLVREPSVALAGLLAIASTVVALIICNAIVSGLEIHGLQTYVFATLIIWVTTAAGDIVARRTIRERRRR